MEVTTEHQKWPKMTTTSVKSFVFARRGVDHGQRFSGFFRASLNCYGYLADFVVKNTVSSILIRVCMGGRGSNQRNKGADKCTQSAQNTALHLRCLKKFHQLVAKL